MRQARRIFEDETRAAITESPQCVSFQFLVLKISLLRANRGGGNERERRETKG